MLVLIDSFLKSPPGFVALVSGLVTLIYFIATRLIQVLATDEINKLFSSKVQQVNLKIWHFLTAAIYSTILFAGSGLAFNYSFNKVDLATSGIFQKFIVWSIILFLISLLIVVLSPSIAKKFKKFTRVIVLLIMFNMILGLIVYCFVFNQITYIGINLNNLSIVVLLPLILVSLYSFIFSKINAQKSPIKYLIKLVSEDKIKIEKLIHGHMIDEKRTVCFPKASTDKDIFYLCDFSAKIYLKYEKEKENENEHEHEDNKFATSATNKVINRKIHKKRT
ncbi:hypothetical protein [Bacillus pseudomycoides]|uniref:hypothetical protein n=1 Tax=Bacillus pseudomycoides TaxID=64104 RepID=UPI000BEC3AF0|nr:hypothetical protein [Bacillus pseudomycoides]PEF25373.1 hypothetical protein CON69_07205 [Bacillus pseudomycoides]PEK67404.1 hypothetical protein CN593_14940 [Bacillus pseudomycoides]PFY58194.1 hypothetical protein COL49_13100 [Bacillus pseudomycoides]PGE28323.1 hypothetical protein COM57_11375 [Bacillus pseudomycoides]